MNNEQLRAEFEALYPNIDKYHPDDYAAHINYTNTLKDFTRGYLSAAQSRDELIEKLVHLLEACEPYVDRETLQEAIKRELLEARTKGYGHD